VLATSSITYSTGPRHVIHHIVLPCLLIQMTSHLPCGLRLGPSNSLVYQGQGRWRRRGSTSLDRRPAEWGVLSRWSGATSYRCLHHHCCMRYRVGELLIDVSCTQLPAAAAVAAAATAAADMAAAAEEKEAAAAAAADEIAAAAVDMKTASAAIPLAATSRAKAEVDKQAVARAEAWEVVAADAAKVKEEGAATATAAVAAAVEAAVAAEEVAAAQEAA